MATTSGLEVSAVPSAVPFSNGSISCSIFNGEQHKCDAIIGVKRFFSLISALACLFVIFCIWLFRRYLVFVQRLILCLSIVAVVEDIIYFVGDEYDDGPHCTAQGWFLQFLSWAVLMWNCCITVNLYLTAIKNKRTDKFEWAYHGVSFVIPLVMACLPLINNSYGPAGLWCWIKSDNWGWRFGAFYLPLFLLLFIMLAAYIYIMVVANRQAKTWEGLYDPDSERKKTLLKEDLKPLQWYPFVYIATFIFPLVNRIQNAASSTSVFPLMILQAIGNTIYGFTISIVFLTDKDLRSRLTIPQIKMALQNRGGHVAEIREYPVAFRQSPPAAVEDTKYVNVSYTKLR